MKNTIYKYPLQTDKTTLSIPFGAVILTVQEQYGKPCIWAMVDLEQEAVRRTFCTYGTGEPMPPNPGKYIGTLQLVGGKLVFHVFEEPVA